jgi:EAL domain-containing protein (putative c-di-GMP-specific phosphodiesterase class I)
MARPHRTGDDGRRAVLLYELLSPCGDDGKATKVPEGDRAPLWAARRGEGKCRVNELEIRNDQATLVDYAARLSRHTEDRRAVRVHLSGLGAQNRREHHLRIALNCFDPLVQKFSGEIFVLCNDDIVFVCKGATVAEIDDVVLRLRFLFSEDPLAWIEEGETKASSGFCTWYDLDTDYEAFREMALDAAHVAATEPVRMSDPGWSETEVDDTPSLPLDPEKLGLVEQALASVDIDGLLACQPVSVIAAGGEPTPVFNEIYISIAEVQRRLMPEVDLASNRWLFQHLTTILDRRLLANLSNLNPGNGLPVSVNLNVSTLLSPEFLDFDSRLRAKTKKPFIFELQIIDIFADMAAFMFARDVLHERNYRLCIDGLSNLSFPLIDREYLGFDMLKIFWSADMEGEVRPDRRGRLRDAVALAGPSRVILCRCESDEAVVWGRSLGITMYQGRYVDALLRGGLRATG